MTAPSLPTPLRLAGLFHDEYARRAPSHGVVTDWPEQFRPTSPHGTLLLAVCTKVLREIEGCKQCGGHNFHYVNTLGNDPDIILGDLKLCLDCGQVQGQWPFKQETADGKD